MARLSKSKLHSFTIFDDTGTTGTSTKDPEVGSRDTVPQNNPRCQRPSQVVTIDEEDDAKNVSSNDRWLESSDRDVDADDERRESLDTATSISSVAESVIWTSVGNVVPTHQPYTPPFIRPSFRRPQSVQRMKMTSPIPSRTGSPRQSVLSKSRSRAATPRSIKTGNSKGSPRSKKWMEEESDEEDEAAQKQDPLVLLHVVLLPIELPWSEENMQELMSQQTLDDLRLLRSRISANVLQRGVLIPHPGDDYELLEDRLLEALGLQEGRITACGHFVRPEVRIRSPSVTESETDIDSGHGSSIDSLDGVQCHTCRRTIKVGPEVGKKWEIKAFAANGLLRSAAWAAAWEEMERVDVEILPILSDDVRGRLDEMQKLEYAERRNREMAEEMRLTEERTLFEKQQMASRDRPTTRSNEDEGRDVLAEPTWRPTSEHDLPQVYRPSQVPISILLKNYVYLLAQDRRNVVLFCLATLLALLLATKSPSTAQPSIQHALVDHCGVRPSAPELMSSIPSDVVQHAEVEVQGVIPDHLSQGTSEVGDNDSNILTGSLA